MVYVVPLASVSHPAWIDDWHLVGLLVILNNATKFFAIGLTLRLSRTKDYLSPLVSLSLIKFVAATIAAAALIWLAMAADLQLGPLRINVMLVESAIPSAVFAVVAAGLYGLSARLASSLFVISSAVFLAVVLPVIMILPWPAGN